MKKKRAPVDLITHILFIIVMYILQSMVFKYLPINGIFPVLLPVAVAGIATFEGSSRGGGYGLLAGMLCDISFNQPVIVMTVTFTLMGIIIGFLSETVMARGFPTFFISCLGALILTAFVSMFSLLFFTGVEFMALVRTGLMQTLYSMLFTFPVYFIVRALGRRVATD